MRLVLLQTSSVSGRFASPSEYVKRRLVREILAPEDPLKATLEGEGV